MRFFPRVALLFLFTASSLQISRAETPDSIPDPQKARRSWVADVANVIDENTERQINARISTLEKSTSAEIAVVTVNNLGGKSERDFANDLFNRWGVGKSGKDNGVLILAAISDRKTWIEVGYGLEPILTDARTGQLYRDVAVPAFRAGNYGAGLLNLSSRLARVIETDGQDDSAPDSRGVVGNSNQSSGNRTRANNPPAQNYVPPAPSNPSYTPSPSGPSQSDGAILLFFLLGGGGLVAFIVWLKTRPKKCPKCSSEMVKVPAELEAPHLSNAQEYEQQLGGRDWVVWRCPNCEAHEIEAHDKWFSGVEDCTFCGNKTAQRHSRILSHPTRYSEGLEEITHACSFPECGKSRVERRTIPRIPPPSSSSSGGFGGGFGGSSSSRSSSSGGGSFGGGRSGGGGAGGSW